MKSVGTDFPNQMVRVRELMEGYKEIGPAGVIGLAALQRVMERAKAAWESQDVVAVLQSYQEMKECE